MTSSRRSERLYLTDILDAIDKVTAYTRDGRDAFLTDPKTQDAVIRNLEIIGEAAKNLSTEMRQAHPQIPWPDIVGMRDRVVHGYFNVNLQIVWDVVANDLEPLRAAVAALLESPLTP